MNEFSPVPIPIGTHLLAEVRCPYCERLLHFRRLSPKNGLREVKCQNKECMHFGYLYEANIDADGCFLTQILKRPED